MATYPIIDWNDPELDWQMVEVMLLEMYSDLHAQTGCCKSPTVSKAFIQAGPPLDLLRTDKISNTVRWQADIKAAYLILQAVTSGPVVTVTNGTLITGLPFILT